MVRWAWRSRSARIGCVMVAPARSSPGSSPRRRRPAVLQPSVRQGAGWQRQTGPRVVQCSWKRAANRNSGARRAGGSRATRESVSSVGDRRDGRAGATGPTTGRETPSRRSGAREVVGHHIADVLDVGLVVVDGGEVAAEGEGVGRQRACRVQRRGRQARGRTRQTRAAGTARGCSCSRTRPWAGC